MEPDKKLLLEEAIVNNENDKIFELLPLVDINDFEPPLLLQAVEANNYVLVEKLIADYKVDINVSTKAGYTALHWAISGYTGLRWAMDEKRLQILRLLLKQPTININAETKDGITPFDSAIENNNFTALNLLLKRGFKPTKTSLDKKDSDGRTLLIRAILLNNIEIAKTIIKLGADINIVDNALMTAKMYAAELDDYNSNNDDKDIYYLLSKKRALDVEDPLVASYKAKERDFRVKLQAEINKKPPKERWTYDHDDDALIKLFIASKDYTYMQMLIKAGIDLQLQSFMTEDELFDMLKHINPLLFDKLNRIPRDDISFDGVIQDKKFPFSNISVRPDSSAASFLLIPKTTPNIKQWIQQQETYLTLPERRTIARAYTFRGDRLLNLTLRGESHIIPRILLSIKFCKPEENPLAFPIYKFYDKFVRRGYDMPDKSTLLNSEGVLNYVALHDFFIANYDRIKHPSIYNSLIEILRRAFNKVIRNAPRLAEDFYVYRGTKNDTLIESGAYSYVSNTYSSTSLSPSLAANFANHKWYGTDIIGIVLEIKVPAGTPCLYLPSVSMFPSEYEVLLPHNLKMTAILSSNIMYTITNDESIDSSYLKSHLGSRVYVKRLHIEGYGSLEDEILKIALAKNPTVFRTANTRREKADKNTKQRWNRTKRINKYSYNNY